LLFVVFFNSNRWTPAEPDKESLFLFIKNILILQDGSMDSNSLSAESNNEQNHKPSSKENAGKFVHLPNPHSLPNGARDKI